MNRVVLLAFVFLTAISVGAEPSLQMIEVQSDIHLETLDWAGPGRDVLLLAGLGQTAHIYEYFAPRLASEYHVVAMTRRGYGASTHAAGGYTPTRLALDIIAVCDSLNLTSPVLVGHSLAGAEMAHAARLRPGRFAGFVFLDAAYDPSLVSDYRALAPPPVQPAPRSADRISSDGVRNYIRRTRGYLAPETEIAALHVFTADGRLKDMNSSKLSQGLIMDAMTPPPFRRIDAPALAIFIKPTLASLYPAHVTFSPAAKKAAKARIRLLRQLMSAQLATFEANSPNTWTQVWDGSSHHLFLTEPTRVLTATRALIEALPPQAEPTPGVNHDQ